MLCGPFNKIHLLNDSLARLKLWLNASWQEDLLIRLTERRHLFGMLPISRTDTVQTLNTFEPTERGYLVREIAGAFQTQHQKAQWQEEEEGNCRFCSQPDSRHRRIFDCPFFAAQRAPFQSMLDWYVEQGSLVADLPVVHEHPDEQALRVMQYAEAQPILASDIDQIARQRRDACLPLHLYVDGSCVHPDCPTSRYAGFAVIADLCTTDQERISEAETFLATGAMPQTLQPVCRSRLQGEQNIGRAELAAIVVATKLPGEIVTHSDSQSSLQTVDRVSNMTFDYLKGNDLDLVELLAHQLQPSHVFLKIKAHQPLTSDVELLELYQRLGNELADREAKRACDPALSTFTASLSKRHCEQQAFRDNIIQMYKWILTLQQARLEAEQALGHPVQEQMRQALPHQPTHLAILCAYQPTVGYHQGFSETSKQLFPVFPWGEQLATQMQQWCQHLFWPTQKPDHAACRSGVSWLELGLSFSLYLGKTLPIIRQNQDGTKQIVFAASRADATRFGITLGDYANVMQLMWGHYMMYLQEDIRPAAPRGLTRSLMWLGFGQHTSGLLERPSFFAQDKVLKFFG